ncbi:MAG: precorrin-6A synthase (deacetylating) [Proteobacteria bacterium]|nr:precorrin-6A synthase (deacetylating) [Pseudomonadota bacterium]
MIRLALIGIGMGSRAHLTLEAIEAIARADLILIPEKGEEKADLAALRRAICDEFAIHPRARLAPFAMPRRDEAEPDYRHRVEDWHARIAAIWAETIRRELGEKGHVALLVWGDPSLYDSTLRIAQSLPFAVETKVVPGITALQALAAAHAIPLNTIGGAVTITTGRNLRDKGWPEDAETLAVLLDGTLAFETLLPGAYTIWWGAFLGLPHEILIAGPLAEVAPSIRAARAAARDRHGWIMDTYLLRRAAP